MKAGASVLVNDCAGVCPGDQVAVVADPALREIADALLEATAAAGGIPVLVMPPPRVIDNEEPPATVAGALVGADVVFLPVALAMAHTRAVREAIARGARVVSMTAFTPRMMREGGLFTDFRSRQPVCLALADRLSRGSALRVTSPAGTDLTMGLEDVVGNSHACLLDGPGFTAVPNIEANCSPAQGTCAGRLVVDGSIPYYGVGVIRDTVEFVIEDGFVTSISGGDQARFLSDLLSDQDDRWVYNVAQFAFGLNPLCTEFTGEMLNDEGVNGTIHLGIGTSANLGGTVSAKTHFDAITREPTVWIDEEIVVREGEVLVQP
ncbi:MAG: aminopeptidase [Gemmatimonadetes bacterium]|nr:aminopeptidase [Gemmatimonadota bacterium]NNM04579.1 aminopeptidase [Gemmatimonadota bacterium]